MQVVWSVKAAWSVNITDDFEPGLFIGGCKWRKRVLGAVLDLD